MTGCMLNTACLLMACCCLATQAMQVNESPQSQLYDTLLNGNVPARPVKDWGRAVEVYLSFYVIQLKELDSVEQTISVVGLISMIWFDEYLHWNSSANGIHRMQIPARKIWTPEFSIYNSASGIFRDIKWYDYDPIIHPSGMVTWNPSGIFTTSCSVNILYFPFDNQECSIAISNWAQIAAEINFQNMTSKVNTNFYLPNSEWVLKDTSLARVVHFNGEPGEADISSVYVTFKLSRRFEGYISTIIVPLIFISIMGMLVFPLPPESGEKVSLGVTMLLAFSVFQLLISENLPKSSEDIPYIMIYVVVLMAMNASSIAMTVIVLHFHHKDPAPRMPRWLRKFLFGFLAKVTCSGSTVNRTHPEVTCRMPEKDLLVKDLEKKKPVNLDNDLVDLISDTLQEVQKITKKIEENEEEEEIKGEWKRAAGILDRFFFIASFVAWLISTIVIIVILLTSM